MRYTANSINNKNKMISNKNEKTTIMILKKIAKMRRYSGILMCTRAIVIDIAVSRGTICNRRRTRRVRSNRELLGELRKMWQGKWTVVLIIVEALVHVPT